MRYNLTDAAWPVLSVAFSADGCWLVSADDNVYLYDLSGQLPKLNVVLSGKGGHANSLAFSPDTHWLATGSSNHLVYLYNMTSGKPELSFNLTDAPFGQSLAFSANSRWLIVGGDDQMVYLYDLSGQRPKLSSILVDPQRQVTSVAFSADSRWMGVGTGGQQIYLYDMINHPPTLNVTLDVAVAGCSCSLTSMAFSPDGSWLGVGGSWERPFRLCLFDFSDAPRMSDIEPFALRPASVTFV